MSPSPRGKGGEIGSVLHDLATPLAAARGWAELLCQAGMGGAKGRWATRLAECLAELAELLVGANRGEAFAPLGEVEALARTLELRCEETGTRFLCSRRGRGPWRVRGARVAFRRIATNLLSNVLRHAPGGCVEVEVLLRRTTRGWMLRLEVGDEGPGLGGMAAALFRAGQRNRVSAGRGLGLHNVRELARANGGEAGVVGEAGGARFWAEMIVAGERGLEPGPLRRGPVILAGGSPRERRWLARLMTRWKIACAEVPAEATADELARANRELGGGAMVLAEGAPRGWADAGLSGWADLGQLRPCGPGDLIGILDGGGDADRLAKNRGAASLRGTDAENQGQAPA
jgi:hypothetical protein